jgi:hypothetical protein
VIAPHAVLRRSLFASTLAAALGLAWGGGPAAPAEHPCAPAQCTLARPTPAESAAVIADADRILGDFAGDETPLGRECRALGAAMKARAADVRMLEYMWRAADPDGTLAPVTGDAHTVEPAAGAGRVHIARGFDPLNPDRGLPAILHTARHEFAHLAGARQGAGWRVDMAEQLASACGPTAPPRRAAPRRRASER